MNDEIRHTSVMETMINDCLEEFYERHPEITARHAVYPILEDLKEGEEAYDIVWNDAGIYIALSIYPEELWGTILPPHIIKVTHCKTGVGKGTSISREYDELTPKILMETFQEAFQILQT